MRVRALPACICKGLSPWRLIVPVLALAVPGYAQGPVVSGTVPFTAACTDNVGCVSMDFLVDGVVVGIDTVAPYSIQWDTTQAPNGQRILTAEGRDAAGNVGTSPPVVVDVANADTEPPEVVITAPVSN